jgi:DNA-binding transcriptional regulator GbsR (MarR family)
VVKAKPKVKPHITALKELEKLKVKKLWQNGQVKQYYSELTDILRTYIDGRYDINAMEMISSDILKELEGKELPEQLRKELEQTLGIADLVKFAKMEPLPDDHDRCFKQAVNFVQETAEQLTVNS